MAETAAPIVCGFLQPIWNSAYRSAERQLKPICGYKKEVEELQSSLLNIEEKISKAEKVHLQTILKFLVNKAENEENLRRVMNDCLPKLKGLYCDVDDVLDKWNTVNNLMEEIEESSKKVCCCLIPSFYLNRLSLLREIAVDIEPLMKKLLKFGEKAIDQVEEHLSGQLIESLRLATSSYGLPEVYGRDNEKDILISKLIMSDQSSGSCVSKTILILGMGGVGKTTLAQLVFSDDTVNNHFITIWVSVPYKFDLNKILRSIIEQVNIKGALKPKKKILKGARFADTTQTLLDSVVEFIKEKKLLLVLDDVWNVERSDWDKLIEAFGRSDPSSRILVTTQNCNVVQEMQGVSNDSMIHLELLSPDDCWKIVSRLASDASWNINQQLDQELRDKFWCKCNGLPLIARSLEYRLQSENTKEHWNQDFRSDIVDYEKILFGPFFLNYYGLSPLQRRCFSYCSVLPRNYQIENDDVVELWMSQDYLVQYEKPEKKGLEWFKILESRCMFQDSTKDYNGDIIKCKMHGLVYEFAQFLTNHERVIMEIQGGEEQRSIKKSEKARHFTLLLKTSEAQIPQSVIKKKNLRTLFVVRSETSTTQNPLDCESLVKLTCLRTLNLGHCNIKQLPEDLAKLVHLRYLNLSGNSFKTLPNELCYLFNLQSLRLKGCAELQRLPEEMGNLALKFRHLHIEGCDSLKALPKEIERLTNLQTLDMFIIPSPDDPPNYEALKLEHLNQLEHLHGSIHICQCRNLELMKDLTQRTNPVLNGRRNYHVNLKLNFEGSSNSTRIRDEREILDALQPHSDLMSLEIRGCMDTLYPDWINLLNCLKRLVLVGCRNWESLPPLGKLQSLESLQIEDMDRVAVMGLEFMEIASNDRGAISFPKLKDLHFGCLTNWRIWEWTASSGEENSSTVMPCLASLQVSGCGSLEALPGFLRRTKKLLNLTIDECTILNKRCQEDGEDWDKISHIPDIKIDGVTIRPRSTVAAQASTSGSSAVPTTDSTNGPSTSINLSNICLSAAAVQASTSGSSATIAPGSTAGPSSVMNSSNKH